MQGISVRTLLSLPVNTHGIRLGRPADVLLDKAGRRVVGLDVVCRDGAHRFLPFSVADVRTDEIQVESALMLLDERALEYYRARTRPLGGAKDVDTWIDEHGVVRATRAAA
jgi:hypothetical protein